MVNIGGSNKLKLSKNRKVNENVGKFINFEEILGFYKFCQNKGNIQYGAIHL